MSEKKSLSTIIWVILAMAAIGFAVHLLYPVKKELKEKQSELQKQKAELHELKKQQIRQAKENQALKTSPAAVEKVAREEFNLVRQGESIVYYPKDSRKKWDERRQSEQQLEK